MTTLEKIRAEFISRYPKNYANEPELGGNSCVFSLNDVLQILDKYAERQKCNTCYHNETEFSICQYCTDGNKYEEQEPTDEWQNGYDMAWEEAKVFYEKEEPTSPCDLCRFDYMDGVCGDCSAMAKGGE